MRNPLKWFSIAALVVILDQLSKALIVSQIADGQSVVVTQFFSLVLLYNPGAAFSFLAGASGWQCAFFLAIALAAAGLISFLLLRHQRELLFCSALALVLGGAVGNVIDRIRLCAVVDFLLFHWHEYSFPAFNVADSFITIGAGLLILDALKKSSDDKAAR
jgi:signal peptidase II